MMFEIFKKELANYILQEMYHKSEQEKGYDVEYHKQAEREANICYNATRRTVTKLLDRATFMQIAIEARRTAEEAFEKGIIYID